MSEFRTNIRLVSLNDQGFPDADGPLSVGDLYLTPSQKHSSEKWDEWVWAGDPLGWQRVGSVEASQDDDDERSMRQHRVNRVKQYFKEQELKMRRRNELILSMKRGEHLSREELRELSAMGYTI